MKIQNVFVTGTDTGIGKTVVTALLALALEERGMDVGIMKPFASGCEMIDGKLQNEDAIWLQKMVGVDDDLELINPARWAEPLAPLVAARRAGEEEDYWLLTLEAYRVLRARHEVVIVEGVGGLLAPIAERDGKILTNADWMNETNLPAIIVARRALGTINHCCLTSGLLRAHGIVCEGIIFCDAQPVDENDVAVQTNAQIIEEMSGCAVLASVPFLRDLTRARLQKVATECLLLSDSQR